MRWYEYKMEVDDLHAPDALKAKLLAMQEQAPSQQTPPAKSPSASRQNGISGWRPASPSAWWWAAARSACCTSGQVPLRL